MTQVWSDEQAKTNAASEQLKEDCRHSIPLANCTRCLREQLVEARNEIGRLNAVMGPGGKDLGTLEKINDELIAENEELRGKSPERTFQAGDGQCDASLGHEGF